MVNTVEGEGKSVTGADGNLSRRRRCRSGRRAECGGHQQNSMGQLARMLGRSKSFSGREDEWHDWSLKFAATAAKVTEHASTWMNEASRTDAEITWVLPNQEQR